MVSFFDGVSEVCPPLPKPTSARNYSILACHSVVSLVAHSFTFFFFGKHLVATASASRVVSWLTLMTDTNLQPGDSVYILMDV